MDVFKKLVVARRRNRSSSVVSDNDEDGDVDNNFSYHQHIGDDNDNDDHAGNVIGVTVVVNNASSGSKSGSTFSSLYGRRRRSPTRPPMAVVTSTKFESDEAFTVVARAMIYRYEHENMSEREAIYATLGKAEDKRAFIEAMDLKFLALVTASDGNDIGDTTDTYSEIVIQARSIFDTTLKSMWREEEEEESSLSKTTGNIESRDDDDDEAMVEQQRDDIIGLDDDENEDEDEYYRTKHPKAPKNLRMSPMQTSSSFNYRRSSHGEDTTCNINQSSETCTSTSSGGSNNIFQPFKRPRRWFFAETERQVTPPSLYTTATTTTTTTAKTSVDRNPFVIKNASTSTSLPKFHFDFGGSRTCKNMLFGGGGGPRPVQSLQLDNGLYASMGVGEGGGASAAMTGRASTYMPPTSPIRKVSVEMHMD